MLPGDRIDDLIKSLLAHLGVEKYEVVEGGEEKIAAWKRENRSVNVAVFLADRGVDAPPTPVDTPTYRALERVARRAAPGAVVVPRMSTGATDMRFFRLKGVQCYGVNPCPVGEAEQRTPHHHNERVRVSSVRWGVRFAWDIVMELCK